jgi:hypothetical protein
VIEVATDEYHKQHNATSVSELPGAPGNIDIRVNLHRQKAPERKAQNEELLTVQILLQQNGKSSQIEGKEADACIAFCPIDHFCCPVDVSSDLGKQPEAHQGKHDEKATPDDPIGMNRQQNWKKGNQNYLATRDFAEDSDGIA